jgi:hypothetical protein
MKDDDLAGKQERKHLKKNWRTGGGIQSKQRETGMTKIMPRTGRDHVLETKHPNIFIIRSVVLMDDSLISAV